jgi:YhcG PDDEXK nuclease domain
VDGEDFRIDLLFYHVKLRSYIVIEIKAKVFQPGDVGQLNYYINVIDDILKTEQDNPTIGLLLCKEKNNIRAKYGHTLKI